MTNSEFLKRTQHATLNRRLALALGYTSGEIDTSNGVVRVYRPGTLETPPWCRLDCDDEATWKPVADHFKIVPEVMSAAFTLDSRGKVVRGQDRAWCVTDLKDYGGWTPRRWCIAPTPGQAVAKSVISLKGT